MTSTSFIDSEDMKVLGSQAVLAGVVFPEDQQIEGVDPLDELALLADTLGCSVVGRVIQKMQKPNVATFIGPGKADEIAELCRETGATMLIVNNDLKPQHQRNLAEITGTRVIDRTELILLIFAEHARSHQARLAVDLARLEYQLPRLKHLWSHLERQRGALGKVGGAGERQIEVDRRLIRLRIQRYREELDEIEKRRSVEVGKRHEEFQVALVGYTNAGKSTLMNALTEADVYVADRLFATLDTRTRVWQCGDHKVLLSDTVGFIRDLPHGLVASFHATLSEAIGADLLLHVVDSSHPAVEQMIDAVESVLKELGADGKRTVLVLNKADLLKDEKLLERVKQRYPEWVLVSAKSGAGLTRLGQLVARIIEERELRLTIDVPAGNGRLLAFLQAHGRIISEEWLAGEEAGESGPFCRVKVVIAPKHFGQLETLGARL